MPLDKAKLAKILAMTTSDKEPEVLAAISLCNAMLKKENLTWGDVLRDMPTQHRIVIQRQPYTAEEEWVPPHLKDKVVIDLMFRTVYAQPRSDNEDFWRWLDDVHHKYQTYGHLTQGQYQGLRNSYNRASRTTKT